MRFLSGAKKSSLSTPSNPQLSSTLHKSRVRELGRHAGEPRSILKFARKSCQASPSLAEARLMRFLLPLDLCWPHGTWRGDVRTNVASDNCTTLPFNGERGAIASDTTYRLLAKTVAQNRLKWTSFMPRSLEHASE